MAFKVQSHIYTADKFYDLFVYFRKKHTWAATCDFQQCCLLTSVDPDKPVQPPFKLRKSKWCSVSSLTFIEYSSD